MQVREATTQLVVTFVYHSVCADILEVCWPAVLFGQEISTSEELARCAARTLRRIGTVVIGNMVVANVAEPTHRNVSGIGNSEKRGTHQCTLLESAKRPIPSEWIGASPQRS